MEKENTMFQVGQIVVTRSSGLRSRVLEIIDGDCVKTNMGDHGRTYATKNLCTEEEYRIIWERRDAKRRKKMGRR